ncbi:hypothetical protein K1T71_010580 [Dendrolimus kikuchii]|uniref:Uncharacterized protein n=1 Tax=Dendrolimus kikuchii TaxID=765133 RepID=A0ACC1CPB3_9NEOP|nr:hypothetical protein K1T71_010580 [Dendrolimus kikuchii]
MVGSSWKLRGVREGGIRRGRGEFRGADWGEAKETMPLNENAEPDVPPRRTILWTEMFVASAISMAILLNGFAVGYSYPALTSLLKSTPTEPRPPEIYWLNDCVPLAIAVGSLLGCPLITYIGRKYSLIGTGVPFFISWIVVASSSNLYSLIAGRVLTGLCVGVIYSAFPVYIVETVRPELRGALGVLPIAFRNSDMYTLAYVAAALSVPIFLLFFVTPDSPRWYIAKGREHKARKALQWLRGKNYNIENEMEALTQFQIEADKTRGSAFKQMFYTENTPTILIPLGLMIFKQLSGTYILIQFYVTRIEYGSIDSESQGILTVIISVLSVIVAIVLVDIIGRKMLLYISSGSIIVSLSILGVLAYVKESNYDISFGSLPQLCLLLHVFGSTVGYESISCLMLGEILPLNIRGTAASLITSINWLCIFCMGNSFNNMIRSIYEYGFLFTFISIHLVAIFFVRFCVPETRGKSLEEIENNLTQRVKTIKDGIGTGMNTDENL